MLPIKEENKDLPISLLLLMSSILSCLPDSAKNYRRNTEFNPFLLEETMLSPLSEDLTRELLVKSRMFIERNGAYTLRKFKDRLRKEL
jgi:hypothetical protein